MSPFFSVGVSPSGKASVFGIDIPRFESWYPSHFLSFLVFDGACSLEACARARHARLLNKHAFSGLTAPAKSRHLSIYCDA